MNKLIFYGLLVCLPLKHLCLTSAYGYRIHPVTGKYSFHAGIDLRARSDTVFAVLSGSVSKVNRDRFLGIYVVLDHGEFQTSYGHLSQVFVLPGDSVRTGDALAITGVTGRVTGEHLHFSVTYRHRYIDPLRFLLLIANNINQHKKENNK